MTPLLLVLATLFPPIENTIPNTPFSFPGKGAPREILIVDPSNSPQLDRAYDTFLLQIAKEQTEEEILHTLLHYIRQEIFNPSLCNQGQVQELIEAYSPNEPTPTIPLEVFMQAQTGVCRHIALVAAFLLQKLEDAGILQGPSYLVRACCPSGRHAWNVIVLDKEPYYFDAYWGLLTKKSTPLAQQYYGAS